MKGFEPSTFAMAKATATASKTATCTARRRPKTVARGRSAPRLVGGTPRKRDRPLACRSRSHHPAIPAPEPNAALPGGPQRPPASNRISIGETGFEPATARPPAGCATRLRHSPWSPGILGAIRLVPSVRVSYEHMFVSGSTPPSPERVGAAARFLSANCFTGGVRAGRACSTVGPRRCKAMIRAYSPLPRTVASQAGDGN
jgi:hypothetical protein